MCISHPLLGGMYDKSVIRVVMVLLSFGDKNFAVSIVFRRKGFNKFFFIL